MGILRNRKKSGLCPDFCFLEVAFESLRRRGLTLRQAQGDTFFRNNFPLEIFYTNVAVRLMAAVMDFEIGQVALASAAIF